MNIITKVTLLLIAMHLCFLVFSFHSAEHYLKDSEEYLWQVINLQNEFSFYAGDPNIERDPALYSYRPPAYALFLLPLIAIASGHWLIFLIQSLTSVITMLLLFKLCHRYCKRISKQWILPLLLVFFPAQFIYCNMLMTEILFQFFVFTAFYHLMNYLHKPSMKSSVLLFSFVALAMLSKPVMVYIFIPVVVLIYFQIFRLKSARHSIAILIPLICFLLIAGKNYRTTGYFHYSSIQEKYQLNYLAYLTIKDAKGLELAEEAIANVNNESNELNNFADKMKLIQGRSKELILQHPMSFVKLSLYGMLRFFLEPGRWDINAYFRGSPELNHYLLSVYYVLCFIVNAILLICMLLFFFTPNIHPVIRIAVFITLLYFLLLTGMNGTSRFRIPVYPVQVMAVLMFADAKLSQIPWGKRKEGAFNV